MKNEKEILLSSALGFCLVLGIVFVNRLLQQERNLDFDEDDYHRNYFAEENLDEDDHGIEYYSLL